MISHSPLIFIAALLFTCVAHSADPSVHWSAIETPHFSVIYDSRQQRIAEIYAEKAEQAFAAVSPAFGVWPSKTTIYLDDSTDLANGSATPWPYPLIMAYPVLPLSNDVIGAYGDWGLELITHEYTHILNFTPANGVMKPLRWVFGSLISPNVLLPRWYSEGLAVEMETRYSRFGRLRSAQFLSIARALAIEGKLRDESIARINENIPDFPGGNRPYLMGSLIWDELTRRAGDKIIGELNTAYSRRIPFFIDGPLHDRIDATWSSLLNDVYTRIEARTREQVAKINASGAMNERLVARDGNYNHAPVFSPNGLRLAYVTSTPNTDNLLMLRERPFDRPVRLLEAADVNRISWLPDSSGFIYDSVDTVNRYYLYSDLYRCEIKDGRKCRVKKLTRGLRAREPVVSPDGSFIVFVQSEGGSTRLGSVSIDGTSFSVLYDVPAQTRVSNPTFVSPDELVFSERSISGVETLRYVRLDGRVARAAPVDILAEYKPARLPQMTLKGLVFLSDRSGVSNLYLADRALKSARAVTNTTTRVLDGEIDPSSGAIIYSRLEAAGAGIYASDGHVPNDPPSIAPLIDTSYPSVTPPAPSSAGFTAGEYHPGHYLLPKYWMPYAYLLPGGYYAQASTSGEDPVGLHAYGATLAYDNLTGKPSVFGSYSNSQTPVRLSLSGENIYEYLYSQGLIRQTTAGSLSGSFFLPGLNNKYRGGLGWEFLQTDALGTTLKRNGPRVTLGYSNISQRGFQVSPEDGGSISVSHAHDFETLGNLGYDETDLSLSKFLSGWFLPDHHALAFFASGAWAPASPLILGRSTVGGNYQNGLLQNAFVMRGYGSGTFLGKDMLTGTVEYRFPLAYSYSGLGTWPLFFRRLHAALFLDTITLDGDAFYGNSYQREQFGVFHFGTGAELKLDTTLFYFLPVQFIVGGYYGTDKKLNPNGVLPFVGIGI